MMANDLDRKAVGPAIMAFHALHGELEGDPAKELGFAAQLVAARLAALGPEIDGRLLPGNFAGAILDAGILLGMVAEIFGFSDLPDDDEARLAFIATLSRRRGRPAQPGKFRPQPLTWYSVGREVEGLMEAGMLQKAAVGVVAQRLEMKDSAVAGLVREYRARRAAAAEFIKARKEYYDRESRAKRDDEERSD